MTRDAGQLRGTVRGAWKPRTDAPPRTSASTAASVVAQPIGGFAEGPLGGIAGTIAALRARPRLAAALVALVVFLAVLLPRLVFLDRSFDVFTDEVTYLDVSRNLASGQGVTLHGNPFFLHPPLFFVLEGLVVSVFHPGGLVIDQVFAIRVLNTVLAGITGVALFTLVRRVSGLKAALPAFALFALDPFIIRINSRNLIETSAFMWVVLAYVVLLPAVRMTDTDQAPRRLWRILAAGVLFGFALLSKEMTAFLTVVPIGLAFLLGWSLPRRESLAAIGVAGLTYAIYPLAVVAGGLGPTFAEQKLSGVLRFLGIVKTTGFVSSGGPSFWSAVTQNLDVFATTYVLIALGVPACIALLVWGDPRRRLLGLLGASAYALLAYSIKFGTLEEQFFYYLVLPAIVTVTVAWWLVVEERGLLGAPAAWTERFTERVRAIAHPRLRVARARLGEAVRIVAPVAFAVALSWIALVWFEVHLTPDNGYQRLLTYMHRNVPNGTTIGVTTDPQQFILQGYVIDQVHTVEPLAAGRVRYVAISTKQIQDGYVRNGASIQAWLNAHAQPVFTVEGRSYGTLELFRITPPLTERLPAEPLAGSPPTDAALAEKSP